VAVWGLEFLKNMKKQAAREEMTGIKGTFVRA
jgi:hypothetical protein